MIAGLTALRALRGRTAAARPAPAATWAARLGARDRPDPEVGLTVSWCDAGTAMAALIERRVAGKAVLTID